MSERLFSLKDTYGADATRLKSFPRGKPSQEFKIGKNPL